MKQYHTKVCMLSILYALKHCIEDDIAKVLNNTVARG